MLRNARLTFEKAKRKSNLQWFFKDAQAACLSTVSTAKRPTCPPKPKDILFFGTSAIAVPALDALYKATSIGGAASPTVGKLEVVCPPPKLGRKNKEGACEIDLRARDLGLPIHPLPTTTDFRMNGYTRPEGKYDIGVVISFGYFVRPDIIDSFPLGMINAHGSLLPKFRGASPIQTALMEGESETGISITTLHPEVIDLGKVLKRTSIPVPPGCTYSSLLELMFPIVAHDVVDVVSNFDDRYASSVDQATLIAREGEPPLHLRSAPKIPRTLGQIDVRELTAIRTYRRWQGLTGYMPVSVKFEGRRLRLVSLLGFTPAGIRGLILKGHPSDPIVPRSANNNALSPMPVGSIRFDKSLGAIGITCSGGDEVLADILQIEGKGAISAQQFFNNCKSAQLVKDDGTVSLDFTSDST